MNDQEQKDNMDLKSQNIESHRDMLTERRKDTDIDYIRLAFSANKDTPIKFKHKDTFASAAPIGLFGFGLNCFLLSIHNASAYGFSPVILAMGLAFGGAAQYLAGVFEWIKGKSFTAIVFISYGMFWWSFIFIFAIAKFGWEPAPNGMGLACYLFIWGVFTIGNSVASFKGSKVIWAIFIAVAVLFFLLAASKWSGSVETNIAAGALGIIIGLAALYAGIAEFVNEIHERVLLPLISPGEKCCNKFGH